MPQRRAVYLALLLAICKLEHKKRNDLAHAGVLAATLISMR